MVESSSAFHESDPDQDLPSPPPLGDEETSTETGQEPVSAEVGVEPEKLIPIEIEAETAPAAEPQPEPESEPDPAPAQAPQPSADPAVATTLHIPASDESGEETGGGEWELLTGKIRTWFDSGDFQKQLKQYSSPLKLLAGFLALLVVLRIYAALLGALESLPLVPGLLELAGVIWLSRFALTRLVRSSDRQALLASWQERWNSFRGQS
ncbi:hypothetical protein FQK07_12400 [Synechococcus sp. BSF8S]|uniref:CAAD domain-containing protein n=1 Tax=Synechococcales TaxID=1890424 RepID=UPI001627339C|nr:MULTISPECIES: CAAD domain-containing protein [unclassified Synechococcus]MBC1262047.1 hypothetical protein [Synechococcus sp. BSF8S]MBC1264974.1 hypothetical protein [Synechococcus sp. BSA11S]